MPCWVILKRRYALVRKFNAVYVLALQQLVAVGHLRELQNVSTPEDIKESGFIVIGAAVSLERFREQLCSLTSQPDKPSGASNAAPFKHVIALITLRQLPCMSSPS